MKAFIVIASVSLCFSLSAQHINQIITDTTLHKEVLIDICNREGLNGPVFGTYFEPEYTAYQPDQEILQAIGNMLGDYHITIVMGSWCSDSQEQVPRFYRILDMLQFPEDQLTIICVDRKKKTIRSDIQSLDIQLVPTFILYKANTESGRIIETPAENLEKDILNIIQTVNGE